MHCFSHCGTPDLQTGGCYCTKEEFTQVLPWFFILTQDIFSRCRDKCREFHLPLGWARKAHPQVDEKGTGSSAPSLLLLAIAPKHGKHIIFTHVTHKHDKHGIFDMLNKSHFATITPQEQNFPFLMLLGTLSLHKSTAGLFVSQEFQS